MSGVEAAAGQTHIFTVNGLVVPVTLKYGENFLARLREEFDVLWLMGSLTEVQYEQLDECFTANSFSMTKFLTIEGVTDHRRF